MPNSSVVTERYTEANVGHGPALYPSVQDYSFDRGRGHFVHNVIEPRENGHKIVFLSSSGHSGTYAENDRPVISLPQAGRAEVNLDNERLSVGVGEMSLIKPCQRYSRMIVDPSSGTYESYLVFLPKTWSRRFPKTTVVSSVDHRLPHLSSLIKFAMASLSQSDAVSDRTALLFEALIEDALLLILAAEATTGRTSHLVSVAKDAVAYIEAHYAEPLSVASVADAVGVSIRTLQKAMKSQTGKTMRSQLSQTRLLAMRRSLESGMAGNSVTSAALEAGLFHFGRASQAYRKQFCEAPSETLRRANSGREGQD